MASFSCCISAEGTGARAGGPGSGSVGSLGTKPTGGIVGVTSKNTGESIRVFNGKTRYNEWQFIGMQQTTQAGPGGGGAGVAAGARSADAAATAVAARVGGDGRGGDGRGGDGRGGDRGGSGTGDAPRRGGPLSR